MTVYLVFVIGLTLLLAAAVIANRWRYHDGYRDGHKAASEAANRELDDMLARLGIPANETTVDSLDTIHTRLDDLIRDACSAVDTGDTDDIGRRTFRAA